MRLRHMCALAAAAALVGCSEAGTNTAVRPSKTPPHSYREQVIGCVHDLFFETHAAGNATRVQSPGGRQIANLHFFPTKAAARRFGSQLLVDGSWGGKGVAVWLRDAGDDDKATVQDCLTP